MRVSKDCGAAGSRRRGAREPVDKALHCGSVSAHTLWQPAAPRPGPARRDHSGNESAAGNS